MGGGEVGVGGVGSSGAFGGVFGAGGVGGGGGGEAGSGSGAGRACGVGSDWRGCGSCATFGGSGRCAGGFGDGGDFAAAGGGGASASPVASGAGGRSGAISPVAPSFTSSALTISTGTTAICGASRRNSGSPNISTISRTPCRAREMMRLGRMGLGQRLGAGAVGAAAGTVVTAAWPFGVSEIRATRVKPAAVMAPITCMIRP